MLIYFFFVSFPLWSAVLTSGEVLHYDISYSGLGLGYMRIQVKPKISLLNFYSSPDGIKHLQYFPNMIPKGTSPVSVNLDVIRVVSNVEQLDKMEDICLITSQNIPLFFKQQDHSDNITKTYTNPFALDLVIQFHDDSELQQTSKGIIFDPVSLFYYLRYQDLSNQYFLSLIDQDFTFKAVGEQNIHYQGKQYSTIVMKSDPAKITMWFTNDEARLPVRLEYGLFLGSVVFELR